MSQSLFIRANQLIVAMALVGFSFSMPVYAQSSSSEPGSGAELEGVISQKEQNEAQVLAMTPELLLQQLEQNEIALYALFNTLNSSNDLDVDCKPKVDGQPGSYRHACEPAFWGRYRQEVADEMAQGTARTGLFARIRDAFISPEERTERAVREKAAGSIELLQQEMIALASEHESLSMQLQAIGELQLAYLDAVAVARERTVYLMRQNDPIANAGIRQIDKGGSSWPRLSAPPPGYSQPTIHFKPQGPLTR